MVTIDYLLIGVIALSALMGVMRGFVKEALSLVGWIAAVWGAWQFGPQAAARLPDFVDDPAVDLWIARLIIMIGVLFIGGVIIRIVSLLLKQTGLSEINRVVGMVFGLARGVILIGVVVSLLKVAGFDADPWWRQSILIPYAAPIADRLSDYAVEGIEMLQLAPTSSSSLKLIPKD